MDLWLMDRLRVSWEELQTTPALVVEDALLATRAERDAAETMKRWGDR